MCVHVINLRHLLLQQQQPVIHFQQFLSIFNKWAAILQRRDDTKTTTTKKVENKKMQQQLQEGFNAAHKRQKQHLLLQYRWRQDITTNKKYLTKTIITSAIGQSTVEHWQQQLYSVDIKTSATAVDAKHVVPRRQRYNKANNGRSTANKRYH